MKKINIIAAGVLCAALATTQTPCAQEAAPLTTAREYESLPEPNSQSQSTQNQNAQDPSGQEPTLRADGAPQQAIGAPQQEIFDVERFVAQVEAGELPDKEILPNLNRQNPPLSRERRLEREKGQKKSVAYSSETPVMRAIWQNNMNALATFIMLGADLEKADAFGRTPLELAAQHDNAEALNMLIEGKAQVDAQGHEEFTPLTWAAHNKKLIAVEILLAAGAQPDITNRFGQTALIAAIRESRPNPEIVRLLLNAKADVTIMDKFGKTASVYTKEGKSNYKEMSKILDLLVAAGAQPEQDQAESDLKLELERLKFGVLTGAFPGLYPGHDFAPAEEAPREEAQDDTKEDGKPKDLSASTSKEQNCLLM
jgi:hypothetical protein